MEQLHTTPGARHTALKRGLIIAGAVAALFGILNLAIWGVYYARAYPGVVVGNQHVGNMTRSAIESRLGTANDGYELKVSVKGQEHAVTSESLGLIYDNQMSAMAAISQGKNQWLPLYGLVYTWSNSHLGMSYTVDANKLATVVSALAGKATIAPINAKLVIDGETVTVVADQPGKGIDTKVLSSLIENSIQSGKRQVSIGEQSTTAPVTLKQAQAAVPEVQKVMQAPISVSVNGKVFTPGAAEIGKWLTTSPDRNGVLRVGVNQAAVTTYVATVAKQVDVAAVMKQINMVNGEVRTVSEGKNGSALDRGAVITALTAAITKQQTTTVTGSMKPVAFKTRTNNTVDLNGKYIEVNLSRQHLWAYDNKKLVYDTPITSGATGAGFPTIKGLFSVKAKQTDRYLNGVPLGYNYNVFVHYWMPFSGNYGLHDASWRSSFGGSDYYYGGSHGCVNLPTAAAAWVYNFVVVGTPVWVHS